MHFVMLASGKASLVLSWVTLPFSCHDIVLFVLYIARHPYRCPLLRLSGASSGASRSCVARSLLLPFDMTTELAL